MRVREKLLANIRFSYDMLAHMISSLDELDLFIATAQNDLASGDIADSDFIKSYIAWAEELRPKMLLAKSYKADRKLAYVWERALVLLFELLDGSKDRDRLIADLDNVCGQYLLFMHPIDKMEDLLALYQLANNLTAMEKAKDRYSKKLYDILTKFISYKLFVLVEHTNKIRAKHNTAYSLAMEEINGIIDDLANNRK